MKVLELFAGTRSIGKAFEKEGHEVFSVDWDKSFDNIQWYTNVGTISKKDIVDRFGKPDVIWASPDCTTYSIAAISTHREYINGILLAKSRYAQQCDIINRNLIELINVLNPKYYFIENPRGGLRKMGFIKHLPRYTVTYCQYGDSRMKPTDIWTNHPNPQFKPMCKNGDSCHVSAPRGSRTGTQGLEKRDRSVIPQQLCEHIVGICSSENIEVDKAQLKLEI